MKSLTNVIEMAEWRHGRDRGEPSQGLRHLPRGAGPAGGALPLARRRRSRGREVRRRAGPGHGSRQARQARHGRRPRRESSSRRQCRGPRRAPRDPGQAGSRIHRHRRQRLRPERRRGDVCGHHPRRSGEPRPDATQLPVHTLRAAESAACRGAAIIAGVGVGLWESAAGIAHSTMQFDREFKPRSENAGTYDRLFATYMKLQELAAAAILRSRRVMNDIETT
jgi:hypothetical protein